MKAGVHNRCNKPLPSYLLNQSDNFDKGAPDTCYTSEEEYLPVAGTESGEMKIPETPLAANSQEEHMEGFEREIRSLHFQHTSVELSVARSVIAYLVACICASIFIWSQSKTTIFWRELEPLVFQEVMQPAKKIITHFIATP